MNPVRRMAMTVTGAEALKVLSKSVIRDPAEGYTPTPDYKKRDEITKQEQIMADRIKALENEVSRLEKLVDSLSDENTRLAEECCSLEDRLELVWEQLSQELEDNLNAV